MILKGFIIGIGKILPGVSGAMIAISLGIYEKCIYILSNIKKELINNIRFIMKLTIGFILSILIGSRIIHYFINNYYVYTIYLFIGLIIGTIPSIINEVGFNKKSIFYILIGFTILFLINFISLSIDINSYFILGFIEAISMLIPGVSGTALMMLLGNYNMMLDLLINPFRYQFIIFILGLLFGIILLAKLINYLIIEHKTKTYYLIIGFLISSIVSLYSNIMYEKISIIGYLICILLFIIGVFISKKLNKKD